MLAPARDFTTGAQIRALSSPVACRLCAQYAHMLLVITPKVLAKVAQVRASVRHDVSEVQEVFRVFFHA